MEQDGIMIIVFAALAAFFGLWYLWLQKKGSTPDELSAYKTLMPEMLASLPREKVVSAVAANILAKMDKRRPDVLRVFPLISPERCQVYSMWLTVNEWNANGAKGFAKHVHCDVALIAADGFAACGAPECAAAMEDLAAHRPKEELTQEQCEAREQAFSAAIAAENPLGKAAEFVMGDIERFCD